MSRAKLTTLKENQAKECNLAALNSYITPNELYFVRHRYPVPELDASSWKLHIGGEVEHPKALSLSDLKALPQRKLVVTTECAGNGRTFLNPPTSGLQFSTGAVGTAEWTGISLRDVLHDVGIKPSAVEVLMRGADRNPDPNDGTGSACYERSISLSQALHEDTLLAYEMNGEGLPIEHGFPVRAVVPGWYGMASVKWLEGIELISEPFTGHYQTNEYVIKQPEKRPTKPVTELQIKSLITSPEAGERVESGAVEVVGMAWGGRGVHRVEVSADGGASWQTAQLEPAQSKYAWQRWSLALNLEVGEYVLMARATDPAGVSQPLEPEWNELGYEINPVHQVVIAVS